MSLTTSPEKIYCPKAMPRLQAKACSVSLNTTIPGSARYEVSSVRKALDILAVFSVFEPEWSLSVLARRLQLPKSTTHNLLRTLQCFDLVHQQRERRTYRRSILSSRNAV